MKSGRQFAVFLLLVTFAGILVARLYYWQVVRHDSLARMAAAEHVREEQIPARRGAIYDAAGNVLATNESVDSVYAARTQIEDPRAVARTLSALLQMSEQSLYQRITDQELQFIRLKAWVPPPVSEQIRAAKLPGIFLEPTTHRIYPQGALASQLLGFVNQDGAGQYGLEEAYNDVLAGHPGHLTAEFDTAGRPIYFSTPRDSLAPQNGADLLTSIDSTLQYIAEQALAEAVQKHHATGGTILVMDPTTGDILANANVPTFDPAGYASSDPATFANPTISKIYEPGSTFKVVTMAIGLDEQVVSPTTTVRDVGSLFLGGIHITNWDGKGHAPENMVQLLQYSSNVGAATVAWRI
ncbi:MAG: penicillin-binding protein 2, partial [Chloroflexota bacterium]|nr:penicillin-binding protein 2 [Chloroflexota bacterium]